MRLFLSKRWVTDFSPGYLSFAGYLWGRRAHFYFLFFCHGHPLMTWAAVCSQLCARQALGLPYIYHHSQKVMIQTSQGGQLRGPDISIFLLRSHNDLHTRTKPWFLDLDNIDQVYKSYYCFSSACSLSISSPKFYNDFSLPVMTKIDFCSLCVSMSLLCCVKMSPAVTVN